MSPDWSSDPEALPYAELTDPQTLDLYSYLEDNPLNGVDSDGHQSGCFTTSSYSGNVLRVNVYCLTLPLASAVTIRPPQDDPSWDMVPRSWPITATVGPIKYQLLAGGVGPFDVGELGELLGGVLDTAEEDGATTAANDVGTASKKVDAEPADESTRHAASEQQARRIARQIEKDLGKDARRDFHDMKVKGAGDRTMEQLKDDARSVYEEYGKTPPSWLQ